MIKDALVIVDGSARCHGTIDAALEFARAHRARLGVSVLFEEVPIIAAVEPMAYGIALEVNEEVERNELATIRERIGKDRPDVDLASTCIDRAVFPDAASRQALCFDLALIGPPSSWCDVTLRRRIIEAMILKAAMPTLVFPRGWKASLLTHAVLGWDESAQASRAARALTSLLEPGAKVDVVMIEEGRSDGSAGHSWQEIADHLARHGFTVAHHLRSVDGRSVDGILTDFAKSQHAQLLAVGGYSHSRLRENLLGGVTRALIDATEVPILFAG